MRELTPPPHATAHIFTHKYKRVREEMSQGGQIGGDWGEIGEREVKIAEKREVNRHGGLLGGDWGELGERPLKRTKTNIRLGPTPKDAPTCTTKN